MSHDTAAPSVFDGGGLSASHVAMHEPEAAQVLAELYGIQGVLSRLDAEKDDSFRVAVDGRNHAVLKVSNPHDPAAELDFQLELLTRVAQVDPSIPVPGVIPSRTGQLATYIDDAAGQHRRVWLIEHLPGATLDTFRTTSAQREQVGEVLAKLRHATAGYSHPFDSRAIAWDVQHVMDLEPLLEFVDDERHRAALATGLERLADLQPRIKALRTQVLHNDFSKSNLLGDVHREDFVTGVIDFGDAVRTAVAIDVSTAVLNQLPRDAAENPVEDLFADGRDIVRGYLRHADLTDEELALIPHLAMARGIVRALITTRRAQLFPHNVRYIMRNTEQGWAQLDWILGRSVDHISATFAP